MRYFISFSDSDDILVTAFNIDFGSKKSIFG